MEKVRGSSPLDSILVRVMGHFRKMVEKLHELGLAKVDVSRSEVALLF